MALGDVFAGLADASHQYHTNLLQMDYKKRDELAARYGKIAEDQTFPEDQRTEALRRSIQILTLPYGKKLPKEFESMQFTVTPPTSPKYQGTFGPLPFDERMRRLTQESIAKSAGAEQIAEMRAANWDDVNTRPVQGEDGRRYTEITFARRNPETGQKEMQIIRLPGAASFFAPRTAPGARATAADLKTAVAQGQLLPPLDASGTIELDLDAADPNSIWVPIGENRYVPATDPKILRQIGGQVVPVRQTTGTIAGPALGPAQGGSAREAPIMAGRDAQGRIKFVTGTTVTTPVTPGPYGQPQPAAAPQPPQAQFGDPRVISGIQDALGQLPGPVNMELTPPAMPAPAPYPGQIQVPPPGPAAAPQAPAPQPVPRAGITGDPGFDAAIVNRESKTMLALRPAAAMLFGSPENPYLESLQSFGPLMDRPESRDRVGTAFRVILENLSKIEKRAGAETAYRILPGLKVGGGELTDVVKNMLGLPNLIAKAEMDPVNRALDRMKTHPDEIRMLGRLIAAYGTIVGLRQITSASGLQFSTQLMEKEIPVPGVTGIIDSKSYYNKLSQLAEELDRSVGGMHTIDPGEKQFYRNQAVGLAAMGRGYQVRRSADGRLAIQREDGRWYDAEGRPYQ